MLGETSIKVQPSFERIVKTTEMHTAGCPVRVIESGYPIPKGKTIFDKMQDLKENHDDVRKFVIEEPQGHDIMYAVLLVTPDHPDADIAVIVMNSEGYCTMCGHVTIAIARYAVDRGLIKRPITSPETVVNVQLPCGLVKVCVTVDKDHKAGRACFESVPSFVIQADVPLDIPRHGKVTIDVVYGGNCAAFVSAKDIGLDLGNSKAAEIIAAGRIVATLANAKVPVSHPRHPVTSIYTSIVDCRLSKTKDVHSQVMTFADAVDRSPCGSGTCARVALMYHRGLLSLGEKHTFRNALTGSEFVAWAEQEVEDAGHKGVTVKVEGMGFYCGEKILALEHGDNLGRGFLVE